MDKLVVLWVNGDKVSAENMVLMYSLNAKLKGWWDDIVVIIWGTSTDLVARDENIQKIVLKMIQAGVKVRACKACAENLSALETLESLGVDAVYIGQDFTEYLKDPEVQVITI